jgi:hypothetical protein
VPTVDEPPVARTAPHRFHDIIQRHSVLVFFALAKSC